MKTLLITTAIVVALTASASAQFFRPGGGNFGGPIPNPCAKGSLTIKIAPANAFQSPPIGGGARSARSHADENRSRLHRETERAHSRQARLRTDDDVRDALSMPHDHSGRREAGEIVQRLLAAGLSRYEPNPLEALACKEGDSNAKPDVDQDTLA